MIVSLFCVVVVVGALVVVLLLNGLRLTLTIGRLLSKYLSVLDLGGQVRDVHRVLSHHQSLCRQLLQRQIGKGAVFRPQHMDLDHLAILDLRPLAHQLKPPRIQLQILRALRFFEVLSEVLVADGHLLQGVLGPGPVVVELEEDGSPGLGQQVVRASRVLAHLEDDVALKCIIRAYSCK